MLQIWAVSDVVGMIQNQGLGEYVTFELLFEKVQRRGDADLKGSGSSEFSALKSWMCLQIDS